MWRTEDRRPKTEASSSPAERRRTPAPRTAPKREAVVAVLGLRSLDFGPWFRSLDFGPWFRSLDFGRGFSVFGRNRTLPPVRTVPRRRPNRLERHHRPRWPPHLRHKRPTPRRQYHLRHREPGALRRRHRARWEDPRGNRRPRLDDDPHEQREDRLGARLGARRERAARADGGRSQKRRAERRHRRPADQLSQKEKPD